MRKIQLEPVRHQAPTCDNYGHAATVRQFEVATRIHRAHVEAFEIAQLGEAVEGTYRVTGASGTSYDVDIVTGTATDDTCTCADFLGNDLGTCKHLEAVRRAVWNNRALRTEFIQLTRTPSRPTVTVHAVGGLSLQLLGKMTDKSLAALGWAREREGGSKLVPIPKVDARAHRELFETEASGELRVVRAVVPALDRLRTRIWQETRGAEVREAHAQGRLGVDVLRFPLFPYQCDGALHLVSATRAMLADDMGLGKTAQAIAACEVLRQRGEASRVLIVTVASLKHQWQREIERFTGQRAVVIGGGPDERRERLASDAPYKILNYELTWRELSRLQALDADVVIYDEAQRAKNFRTKTAATLRAIPSRFAFVLTGTPVENRLDDLYSLVQLLDPDLLGPLWKFNLDFHEQDSKGRVVGYKNLAALRRRIAPAVVRRRKEDVLTQLPALTQQARYTAMLPEQLELEEEYRTEAARWLAIAERRPLKADEQKKLGACLVKARQACSALELCDPMRKGSPKLDEFEALIGEIAAQGTSKVLVFSEWTEMLKLAAQRLDAQGIGHVILHGGIPAEKRPALLDRFRESSEARVLLSTDAGGVGLNLQVATYVIHLDLPWSPARLDQRTARAHRMGQTRGVSVIYLCAESGIELGIEKMLAGKRNVQAAALDVSSDIEELDAPTFGLFLKQVRDILENVQDPAQAATMEIAPNTLASAELPPAKSDHAAAPAVLTPTLVPPPPGTPGTPPGAPPPAARKGRAHDRLRLAHVVLQAGFASDAVRAAYEGLAAAVRGLLDAESPAALEHTALVAAIYRDLLPRGRLPPSAHLTLAKLHDLTALEAHGVPVDESLATQAVQEASEWVERLTAPAP
ncbi:SNF2-related protein [Pendulispora albinea]|uniref:DEAD/DEAH box helicase n=1 Tax=Pendulispora albinea TaxID=2741071 RepID=A0ABZ2M3R7_9BACT